MPSYSMTRRGIRFLLLVIVLSFLLPAVFYHRETLKIYLTPKALLPPSYDEYRERENHLDHYDEYELRKDVKYLWSENHQQHVGWGNVMQDSIMNALLSHAAGRSYVFGDYIWNSDGSQYTDYNGHLIPSRIPLTVLLGGMMVGGSMPPSDTTPRAVSKTFFDKVCPNPTIIESSEVNDDSMRFSDDVPASFIFEKWLEKLNSIEDPCVQIQGSPIFEIYILGNKRMLAIWPYLKASPVSTHWEWSPLIYDAYRRNRKLFVPNAQSALLGYPTVPDNYSDPIPGLLALHVRRGDFKDHCIHLAKWSSSWNAFNQFPELDDKFPVPTDGGWGETSDKNMQLYMTHCYPTIEEIVQKVTQVRIGSEQPLTHIYIMTNAKVPWLQELKEALGSAGDWDQITTSRDLDLTLEQKYVAQALDMFVAQRAEVLIGNGWSSLTSNVVMLRMAQNMPPNSNRFW